MLNCFTYIYFLSLIAVAVFLLRFWFCCCLSLVWTMMEETNFQWTFCSGNTANSIPKWKGHNLEISTCYFPKCCSQLLLAMWPPQKRGHSGRHVWSTPVSLLSCTVLDLAHEDRSVQCLRLKAILPWARISSKSQSNVSSHSPGEIMCYKELKSKWFFYVHMFVLNEYILNHKFLLILWCDS